VRGPSGIPSIHEHTVPAGIRSRDVLGDVEAVGPNVVGFGRHEADKGAQRVPDISIWHRGWHITPALATGCLAYLRGRLAQRLLRQDPD